VRRAARRFYVRYCYIVFSPCTSWARLRFFMNQDVLALPGSPDENSILADRHVWRLVNPPTFPSIPTRMHQRLLLDFLNVQLPQSHGSFCHTISHPLSPQLSCICVSASLFSWLRNLHGWNVSLFFADMTLYTIDGSSLLLLSLFYPLLSVVPAILVLFSCLHYFPSSSPSRF
jgi:hypothetical protein